MPCLESKMYVGNIYLIITLKQLARIYLAVKSNEPCIICLDFSANNSSPLAIVCSSSSLGGNDFPDQAPWIANGHINNSYNQKHHIKQI